MPAIPEIMVIVRESPQTSSYRPKGGKKSPLDYAEFCKWLVVQDVAFEDVPDVVKAFWEDAKDLNTNSPESFKIPALSSATRELFSHFRWHSDRDGTTAHYVKVSTESETYCLTQDPMATASAIELENGMTLEDAMTMLYVQHANSGQLSYIDDGETNDKGEEKKAKKMLPTLSEYWEATVKRVWARDSWFRLAHKPKEISSHPDIPSFFYWDESRMVAGPHPEWDQWLQVMPAFCRPVFRAWIFSVLDPMNMGRQALWLQDQGYTGKSSVIRALTRFIGTHAVGALSQGSLASQFGLSSIYGKRLVVYGDNKNPKLLHQEKIHSVLGGDVASIERKNVQAFSAVIHAKILIASNAPPEVDLAARSEVTRILYIPMHEPPEPILAKYCKVEKGKVMRHKDGTPVYVGGDLEGKLFPEIPHFLHSCKKDYEELCPTRTDIVIPEELYDILLTRCPSPEHSQLERFVADVLEFDDEAETQPHDIQDQYTAFCKGKNNTFDWSRLKSYLETQHGIVSGRRKKDGVLKRVLIGVRIKPVTGGMGGLKL